MHHSRDSCAKSHEIKHFLVALNQLGEDFGHNQRYLLQFGKISWLYRSVTFKP